MIHNHEVPSSILGLATQSVSLEILLVRLSRLFCVVLSVGEFASRESTVYA